MNVCSTVYTEVLKTYAILIIYQNLNLGTRDDLGQPHCNAMMKLCSGIPKALTTDKKQKFPLQPSEHFLIPSKLHFF